jgi:trigger factor
MKKSVQHSVNLGFEEGGNVSDQQVEEQSKKDEAHVHGPDCQHDHDHDHSHSSDHDHDFESDINDLGACKKLLRISYPAEIIKKEIEGQYRDLRRNVHLKGFRKGKAPRRQLEKRYGKDVLEAVQNKLIGEAMEHALGHAELNLLTQPEPADITFSPTEGLSFEATLLLRPMIEINDFEAIKVEVPAIKVADEDVDKALAEMNRARGEYRKLSEKETIEEGDQVVADIELWLASELEAADNTDEDDDGQEARFRPLKEIDDVEITVTTDDTQLVSGIVIQNLADDLLGHQVDHDVDVDIVLPTDFDVMEGRGEAAIMRLDILEIRRLQVPEMDESFAKSHNFETVEDLRTDIRNKLLDANSDGQQEKVNEEIVAELIRRAGAIELPSDLVDSEADRKKQELMMRCHYMGMSEEQIAKELHDKEDELRVEAMNELRKFFVLEAVSKKETIEVSDSEVHRAVANLAKDVDRSLPEVFKELESSGRLNEIRWSIQEGKTLEFLRKRTEVVENG